MLPSHYLIVDVEATDKVSTLAQLITGHFLLTDKDFNVIEEYELKARPELWDNAAQESSAIHGIGYDKAKHFLNHKEAMKDLDAWLKTLPVCHFVAHANRTIFGKFSTYDYSVITCNLFHYSMQYSLYRACPRKHIISTHSLAKFLKLGCNYDLKSIAEYLGLNNFKHHDAKADTIVCFEILKILLPKVDLEEFFNKENFNLGVENETTKKARNTRASKEKIFQL